MAVVGGIGHVWGAVLGAGVITILKQWLQDWLPQVLGQSGNFEIIVFGLAMVLVLQKARAGLWPVILRLLPSRAVVREVPQAEPLPRRQPTASGIAAARSERGDQALRRPGRQQQHEPEREGRAR